MTEVSTQQVMELREAHCPSNLKIQYKASWNGGLHMVQGQGSRLYTADGDEYLDCINNVALIGHCHPKFVAAVSQQLATLNTNTRYLSAGLGAYTSRLAATMPDELEVVYMVTSGSEANDLALRLVRNAPSESNKARGTPHIAVFGSAYHGHTLGTLGISPYKFEGRGGFRCPPTTHIIPCADVYRGVGLDGKAAARAAMEDAARAGGHIAAFFFEPMPSCGGQLVFPPSFLKDLCDELREGGALMVADEVQTGFGRVGSHFWAFQAEGVTPDIVTLGKGIGNGFPMGAVATSKRIAQGFANGMEYFNTYGGCNAACAAGLAVLDAIRDEGLQANAKNVGEQLLKGFRALVEESPVVGDGRGAGLFLGLEFVMDIDTKVPAPHVADWVVSACLARHSVLLSTDGPCENVIKVKPPMCFSAEDAEELLAALRDIVLEQLPPRLPQLLELDRLAAEARSSADALRLKIEEALRGGSGATPSAAPAAAAAGAVPEAQPAAAASAASPLASAAAAAAPATTEAATATATATATAAASVPEMEAASAEVSVAAPAKGLPNGKAHDTDLVPWRALVASPVLTAAGAGILAGLGMGALLSYAARRR